MAYTIAAIGVGNMAKAIISGIMNSSMNIDKIVLFDKNEEQYSTLASNKKIKIQKTQNISDAVKSADTVLLSVKPQNFPEVLSEIALIDGHTEKLYISIAAGITAQSVSQALGGANVIRVLPNLPMVIGKGVSVICLNNSISNDKFEFVCDIFRSSGNIVLIDERDMNSMIGVTSSSPAYVFKFINAIYEGALAQGLSDNKDLLDAICDVVIGSAQLLKNSNETPKELISRVASKGGTTERALSELNAKNFDLAIADAMRACTQRADELGNAKK